MRRATPARQTLIALAVLLAFWAPAAGAQEPEAKDLFTRIEIPQADLTDEQQAVLDALEADPTAKSVSTVEMNFKPETADAINFNLIPGQAMDMAQNRIETREDNYTWFGSDPETQGSAVLVVQGEEMAGTIRSGGRLYRVLSLGDGLHAVVEVDPSKFPDDHPPEYEELESATPEGELFSPESDLADDCGTTDLIVAYTPAAKAEVGNIDLLIQAAVDETNESYGNSDVDPRVRLVHSYQVDYVETGMAADRNRFRDPGDGVMDEIHDLRDAHGGDVALLIRKNAGRSCGLAAAILADAETAFAVVAQNCATGHLSFGHEVGHLQGARHNPERDPKTTPFAWGHGLFHAPGGWRTVMAYNCPAGNCTRRTQWSNPNVTFGGVPTGTAATHDNARVPNFKPSAPTGEVAGSVTLLPAELGLKVGKKKDLTAVVRRGGRAVDGADVTFRSANAGIASVPATAKTESDGRATVEVEGVGKGNTRIEAEAESVTDDAEVAVKVPFGSLWALLAAGALALAVFRRRLRAA